MRIRIGPLELERYNDFLPGRQRKFGVARDYAKFFSNDCLDFEIQLVLDRNRGTGRSNWI